MDEQSVQRLVSGVIKTQREHGDIWPSLLTRQFCEFYDGLDLSGKNRFLNTLAVDFGINIKDAAEAVRQFEDSLGKNDRTVQRSTQRLRDVLKPAYETLFNRINQLPDGVHFLIKLRADLLSLLEKDGNNANLRSLNISLKTKLQDWFGIGFLELERLTWSSPAKILDKIMRYEAVHPIESWEDLKQRVGPGRLCYSFFHRSLPQEPLTFVHVALVKELSAEIHSILGDMSPETKDPKAAVFYSITSSQRGLSGVDLGNFLIKRVVNEIQREYPSISIFSTLSPIPGFRKWLSTTVNHEAEAVEKDTSFNSLLLLSNESQDLRRIDSSKHPILVLKDIASDTSWTSNEGKVSIVGPIIQRLCSRYIVLEKKRSFALDPVANFHIRNGAAVHRINWLGDTSEKGMKQSFGIMVNYMYTLSDIESNNQKYLLDGTISFTQPLQQECLVWAKTQQKDRLNGKSSKL